MLTSPLRKTVLQKLILMILLSVKQVLYQFHTQAIHEMKR